MLLPLSTPHAARLEVLPECGSTNTVMVGHAVEGWPDFSVVVTDTQTDGRGRLGRVWTAPPHQTLAVSVLLRPRFSAEHFGWLPLLAGVAMARAVREVLPGESGVGLKWPNDVLIEEKKVSGLLAELVTGDGGPAVVLGAGLNLTIAADDLPTPTSTSLALHGAHPDADVLFDLALVAYLRELRALYGALTDFAGDVHASGIRRVVQDECATLGRIVRVQLPGQEPLVARAVDIDASGRLVVERLQDGVVQAVAAGDVTHLRYE